MKGNMQSFLKLALGAAYVVIAAAVIAFASNALRSDGLPLIRKPLAQSRPRATAEQVMGQTSAKPATSTPTPTPTAIGPAPAVPRPHPAAQAQAPQPKSAPRAASQTGKPKPPTVAQPAKPKPQPSPAKPAKKVQALFIEPELAKARFDDRTALFVDTRAPEDYEAEHIAGAVSLYWEKMDEIYEKVLAGVPKDRLIITYCSDPECASAVKVADALVERGYTRVFIMLEGFPKWKEDGNPTAKGKEPGR